jgi:tetratricopeptide (TPR) repeat protein
MRLYLTISIIVATMTVAMPSWAMSAADVAKIAKNTIVNIDSDVSPGSGVTIRQQGNVYTVLTAAHVVRDKNAKAQIITADDAKHSIDKSSIIKLAGVDLAVVTFRSDRKYATVKLGNPVNSTEGNSAYVAGFPVGTEAISARIFNFTDGKITANSGKPLKDGYSLIYSNNTLPGMSGGGVFNENGELIAIHGKGDIDTKINISNINPDIRIKTGFNLGIPVDTFAKLATKAGINIGQQPALILASNKERSKVDEAIVSGFDKVSKNNIRGAIVDFEQAVKLNPKSKPATFWLGTCRLIMGDRQKAITDLSKAIAINPKKTDAYIYRSFAYAKTGSRGLAAIDADKAVSLEPNSDFTHGSRCTLKFQLRDFAGAIADCNRAIQLNTTNYFHYVSRGAAYFQLNRYPQALTDHDMAIKLAPNDAINYLNRGVTKVKIQDRDGATADFDRGISIDKGLPTGYYYRGLLKAESRDKKGAIADLQIAARFYQQRQDREQYQLTLKKIAELEQR